MRKKLTQKKRQSVKSVQLPPEVKQRKQEEMLGVLLILLGVLVLIALFTYNSQEIPESGQIDYRQVKNGLGIVGVYISHYLIRWTIGFPIVVLPFLIIAWGINRLLRKNTEQLFRWTILSALFALFVSVSFALHESLSVAANTAPSFQFSGRFGGYGAKLLLLIFGAYGSIVVLIGLILMTFLFATTITISQVYVTVSLFLSRFFSSVVLTWRKSFQFKDKKRPFQTGPVIQQNKINRPVLEKPPYKEDEEDDFYKNDTEPLISRRQIEKPMQLDLQLEEDEPDQLEDEQNDDQPDVPIENEQKPYVYPPLDILHLDESDTETLDEDTLRENGNLLQATLGDFGIRAKVIEIHPGPVITRYELELAPGTKVSRITSLSDDLALAMRAKRIRIVAPVPGKAAVGIELPNPDPAIVYLREILDIPEFKAAESPLTIGFGKTISGSPYLADLSKMPHLLVAGSTGSGKSVCLNTIITSFLYKAHPSEVQLLMIDPKRLELSNYAKLYKHHLNYVEGEKQKVATTAKSAISVLRAAEQEMEKRYNKLAAAGVRNIQEYNQRIKEGSYAPYGEENPDPLPYLVVIVDELADLMLSSSASKDVEEPIARLTQMSRAVGIHLILATQRPSVDVITGVIKANFPARIAFQVASKVDSRTILDMNGAEKLLGRGDMLFLPPASPEPIRLHNAFIGLEEIEELIEHIRHQPTIEKKPLQAFKDEEETEGYSYEGGGKRDQLFDEAMKLVIRHQQGSVSLIQRRLKVGYSRAARIIDELEDAGVVGPFEGSKAREVLITPEELEAMQFDQPEDEDF